MYRELTLTFTEDDYVITPNRRLALTLTNIHHEQTHKKVSKPVRASSLNDWLKTIWAHSQPGSLSLLSSFQEQLLWQRIIQTDAGDSLLLPAHRIAQQAMQAHQLLHSFNITLTEGDVIDHLDSQHFLRWHTLFLEQLKKQSLITEAELPKTIMKSVEKLPLPHRFILVGFVDPTPIVQKLFDSLSACAEVIWHTPKKHAAKCQTALFPNPQSEITAMAHWAKQQWLSHPNPQECRIACVAPNLTDMKTRITRLFSDILSNEGDLFTEKPPFNISQGLALLEYPMIRAAFNALKAHSDHRCTLLLSQLLRSPYITSYQHDDATWSAELDATLREAGHTHIKNHHILSGLQDIIPEETNGTLLARWQAYLDHPRNHQEQYPSQWVRHINSLLTTLGWPGQQTLNSEEFQLRERWQKSLLDIAGLDDLLGPIKHAELLNILHQYLSQEMFQAQAHAASIHVLGLLEASGLSFDAVWVMGLDSNTWPAQAQPNPYIPMHIQREHQLPQSSAQRERDFSLAHQNRLRQCTDTLILSSAEHHDDIPREPSMLLADLPKASDAWIQNVSTSTALYESLAMPSNIIQQTVSKASPIPDSNSPLPGGSAMVNDQAHCPFRAFALHRLRARPLKTPRFGIEPALHGILIHHALELIWREIKTHENLIQLSTEERNSLIQKTTQQVMAQHSQIPERLRSSEHTLLTQTLANWLTIEAARLPFRVKETEQRDQLRVGKHLIRVRMDRVDELADGRFLMIDYKTNAAPSLSQCLPPNSMENQLPLYASFSRHRDKTIGFAFAITHKDAAGWSGVIQDDYSGYAPLTPISKLKQQGEEPSWKNLCDAWTQRTQQLVSDFVEGIAHIKPAQPNVTCRYCHCRPICRIGLSK